MDDSDSFESVGERAALLAAVADPIPLDVIHRLQHEGTRCVCDLQPAPPISGNQFGYHLKVPRDCGLVNASRRGRWVDYILAEDALDRLHAALPHGVRAGQGARV